MTIINAAAPTVPIEVVHPAVAALSAHQDVVDGANNNNNPTDDEEHAAITTSASISNAIALVDAVPTTASITANDMAAFASQPMISYPTVNNEDVIESVPVETLLPLTAAATLEANPLPTTNTTAAAAAIMMTSTAESLGLVLSLDSDDSSDNESQPHQDVVDAATLVAADTTANTPVVATATRQPHDHAAAAAAAATGNIDIVGLVVEHVPISVATLGTAAIYGVVSFFFGGNSCSNKRTASDNIEADMEDEDDDACDAQPSDEEQEIVEEEDNGDDDEEVEEVIDLDDQVEDKPEPEVVTSFQAGQSSEVDITSRGNFDIIPEIKEVTDRAESIELTIDIIKVKTDHIQEVGTLIQPDMSGAFDPPITTKSTAPVQVKAIALGRGWSMGAAPLFGAPLMAGLFVLYKMRRGGNNKDSNDDAMVRSDFYQLMMHWQTSLQRNGRRSRAGNDNTKKMPFDTSKYEMLSMDDLKQVLLEGFGYKAPSSMNKATLIHELCGKYEALLKSMKKSDIKKILAIKEMHPSLTHTRKRELIQLAIEAGF